MIKTCKILPKFMLVFSFIIIHYSLLITNCSAQSITWQRTYNYYPFNQDDIAYAVCTTTDGNFIVAGSGGNGRIWVIKINSLGDTIWTANPINGVAYAVVATNDGGCILTGLGNSTQAFTTKLASNGNIVWNNSYGGTDVRLYCIVKTSDGGYAACGRDWRTNIDGLIIKIDSLGNLLWMKYYLAGFDKTLFSITQSTGGNLLVTGTDEVTSGGGSPPKTLIMKLNAIGDSIWVKRYSVNNTSCLGQNIKISLNSYVIGGRTGDPIVSGQEWPFIIKLDTNGNLIFKKNYTSSQYEAYLSFGISNNNYMFSTSIIYGINHITGKVYVTDTSGIVVRQKEFNDTGQVELNSIFPLSNGDIMFAGYRGNYGPTRNDFYVIRTDSILNFPPIGIHNYTNNIPNTYVLYQNFPNPFNPSTKIKYDLPKEGMVSIKVYDLLGREIYSFSEFKKAGTFEINFDGTNFASGLYFYKFVVDPYGESGTFAKTNRMVLLK